MQTQDTRQAEYSEIHASCGHTVFVRLERNPITAAEMVAYFHQADCGRATCPAAHVRLAARPPRTSINDVGDCHRHA